MSGMWELFRKEAMQWEYEIDLKLISLSKLCLKGNESHIKIDIPETNTLLSSRPNDSKSTIDLTISDIQKLLTQLEEVNDKMANYVQSSSTQSFPPTYFHTLQRHREIFQDYRNELETLKNSVSHNKQRDELLGSIKKEIAEYKYSSINRRTDLHLKEHEHIKNSEKLIDHHIEMAMFTKENLKLQKRNLLLATKKINLIIEKFPIINRLSQKISFKKRKETIILSLVISFCFIFLFYYIFH